MSASDLKRWMEQNGKSVIDVAGILKIHTNTIYRFLQGKPVHQLTRRVIDGMLEQEHPRAQRAHSVRRKEAVG